VTIANGVPAAGTFSPVQKKSTIAGRMIVRARHLSSVLPADGNSDALKGKKIFLLLVNDDMPGRGRSGGS
jgi:hypothetical protein